ncbi:hypothetical protein GS399_05250 [Pedobacter sp. HMF7647]|uniref:Uncharacterized protein n=1 Tax=Hufsiella arboris TaxID=2695275 RepID=A0A7K1Y7K1_9SPHI|nr:hypothetical protein [Hufsiella arboris]MXV50371.1 hypothetical protein [Hufsiella arboris]
MYSVPGQSLQSVTDNGSTTTNRVGIGNVYLSPGNTEHAGYIEFYKGGVQNSRLGYIGYDNSNVTYSAEQGNHTFYGNLVANNKVGIGAAPLAPLDVSGDMILRNYQNIKGGGSSILFTPYGDDYPHSASIRSYLDYAEGVNSRVRLVLSSFWAGKNQDELTLIGGSVGIGTKLPDEKLTVYGNIHAQGVRVDLNVPYADYVFNEDYQLPALSDLRCYISQHHHLPEIPSAQQVAKDGINLGEMNVKLLQKIEELTLYLIEKDEQLKREHQSNETLIKRLDAIEKQISNY